MGRTDEVGDVQGVVNSLPVGSVIIHPVYTPGKGILSQDVYTRVDSSWTKTTVTGNDML